MTDGLESATENLNGAYKEERAIVLEVKPYSDENALKYGESTYRIILNSGNHKFVYEGLDKVHREACRVLKIGEIVNVTYRENSGREEIISLKRILDFSSDSDKLSKFRKREEMNFRNEKKIL